MSDLHLETNPGFQPKPAAGADLLVLVGDGGSYQRGSRLTDTDFGLARFAPQHGWPCPVLYVPGIHEYDCLDFDETHTRLRETCERRGITWREREVCVIGGVRFVGTTLWSDFDALLTEQDHAIPERAERKREKAYRAANYYLSKAQAMRHGRPWRAEGWREQALVCGAWLREQLATPFDGTTAVITHFAPSLHSADPRYGITPGTAGFCNSMDDLLDSVQWWFHGHLHCQHDYVDRGCRVIANTLGYATKGEQEGFREELVIPLTA